MATRALAAALLVISGVLAWLALSFELAARLLQLGIAVSVGYVAYLAWHGWRVMRGARAAASSSPLPRDEELPFVTLLVPARDEESVIARVLEDLVALDYGDPPRVEVILIDDGSTDATGAIAGGIAASASVLRIVRREPGSGPRTKGAVLAFARDQVRGEIIGVFDADARVPRSALRDVMRAWSRDPGAEALQLQRRCTNAGRSWLTAAQAEELLMDMASQCGRWATDGTAELRGTGMFVRRATLERLGGWDPEALTEDLELSSRLAVAGARVTLAPEAWAGEQAVERPRHLWRQRLRWAEGSLRRLMDHGPGLLLGPFPLSRKADFIVFATEFLVPPLFVATVVASLLTIPLPGPADWTVPLSLLAGYGIGMFMLALAGLGADGRRGGRLVGGATRGALFLAYWLLVIPAALARIAFWRRTVAFAKTPRAPGR